MSIPIWLTVLLFSIGVLFCTAAAYTAYIGLSRIPFMERRLIEQSETITKQNDQIRKQDTEITSQTRLVASLRDQLTTIRDDLSSGDVEQRKLIDTLRAQLEEAKTVLNLTNNSLNDTKRILAERVAERDHLSAMLTDVHQQMADQATKFETQINELVATLAQRDKELSERKNSSSHERINNEMTVALEGRNKEIKDLQDDLQKQKTLVSQTLVQMQHERQESAEREKVLELLKEKLAKYETH